ncbi:MAG: dockerin type I repeat-containing protein [Dehalococcoidia bacterium]
MTIGPLQAGPGEVRSIELQVLGVAEPGLGAWTVDIHYDPNALTLQDCHAEFGGVCNPAFSSNSARVAGTSVFGETGDPVLGSLSFVCNQAGQSSIELSIDVLADATLGGPLPINAKIANVTATCTAGPSPTEEPQPLLGDVDCDNDVDSIDATLVLQYVAEIIDGLDCPENADVNEDGVINAIDAAVILQITAGLLD